MNGAILDAIAVDRPGRLLIADPFAGGGTIPLAAAIRGHAVYAQDLNPWAASGLTGMLGLPAPADILAAADRLRALAAPLLERAYGTVSSTGDAAEISHTFRVATASCPSCDARLRLYPHALVSLRVRRERGLPDAFLACPAGHLFEGSETAGIQDCPKCGRATDPASDYTRQRIVRCHACGEDTRLEILAREGSWEWEVVLVERAWGRRRELGLPTSAEIAVAQNGWDDNARLGPIPQGQETRVLLRHGFTQWDDLYPPRQHHTTTRLLDMAAQASDDPAVVRALRLAIIGSAEMAGLLSRWDRFYLKSYESMAGHRFNFTTFAAEPNVWGALASGRGSVSRRIRAFAKASRWFESRTHHTLRVEGPLLASRRRSAIPKGIDVRVVEGSSERMALLDGSVDLVLTDPPYHDDVQYGELSLPLRAWAELSLDHLESEALVNQASGVNAENDGYRKLLAQIFSESRRTLKPHGHLIFSYANRDPGAWIDLLGALQDAGFHGCGYAIVHSENETDLAKRGVRACSLDLIIDVVPVTDAERWQPDPDDQQSAEEEFLHAIGAAVLDIGTLTDAQLQTLKAELEAARFLTDYRDSSDLVTVS